MSDDLTAQILASLNRIDSRLDEHIADEDERMERIIISINNREAKSEERHSSLIQSINSYMDKSIAIETAFLVAHDGNPDFHGHYQDHHSRKRIGDWMSEARNKSLLKIVEYMSLSFVLWFLYTVWDTLLKGPHK